MRLKETPAAASKVSDRDSGLDWTDVVTYTWETGRSTAQRLGVEELLSNLIPDRIQRSIPNGESGGRIIDASSFEQRINFETSDAVALPHGLIYVLTENDDCRDELMTALAAVSDDQTGTSVFTSIESADDVYSEPVPRDAPDLIAQWTSGFEIKDLNADEESRVFGPPQKFRADNRPDGTLIAAGPQIATDVVTNPRLIDLAPTFYISMGRPFQTTLMEWSLTNSMRQRVRRRHPPPRLSQARRLVETDRPLKRRGTPSGPRLS